VPLCARPSSSRRDVVAIEGLLDSHVALEVEGRAWRVKHLTDAAESSAADRRPGSPRPDDDRGPAGGTTRARSGADGPSHAARLAVDSWAEESGYSDGWGSRDEHDLPTMIGWPRRVPSDPGRR
jgi:hypothetical protein